MKTYKATYNFKCRNQLYEVGKTYTSDKMKMCKYGIHFCEKMVDTLNYYDYDPKTFVLLEVEVIGETDYKGDKGVTDKLKVLRVVPKEEYDGEFLGKIRACEWDGRGNMISETCPDGDKHTYEYDERNNMIYETCPGGGKYTFEYDERNNRISVTYPDGDKHTYEYDERNNRISETYPGGYKYTYEHAVITCE